MQRCDISLNHIEKCSHEHVFGLEVNWDVEQREKVMPVSSVTDTAWLMENIVDRKHKSRGRAGWFKYLDWVD